MQYYAATIRRLANRGEPAVYGYGDSGFAASGRGEPAVPTTGKIYLLHRVASCLRDVHPVLVIPVDEKCTTMKCHGCGNVLQSIYPPRRWRDALETNRRMPLRGLKLCRHCTGRNRDKNASRNIWEVLHAMVEGLPRPGYLEPAPRRRAGRGEAQQEGQAVG